MFRPISKVKLNFFASSKIILIMAMEKLLGYASDMVIPYLKYDHKGKFDDQGTPVLYWAVVIRSDLATKPAW